MGRVRKYKEMVLVSILFLLTISFYSFSFELKDQLDKPLIDKITREEGLSNLSVSAIIQDKYGFLWFATQGGLNSYDGKDFQTFRNHPFEEDGLVNNLIQTTFYDEENHEIWIGTYQGISRYNIFEDKFINYSPDKDSLSNPVVTAISKDSSGFIWAGTLSGLNKIDPESGEIIQYSVEDKVVRDLLVDSRGQLLVATYKGIYAFNYQEEKLDKIDINLPSDFVMVIKEFTPGVITAGLWDGGLISFHLDSEELQTWSFANNNIYSIEQTKDGTIWAGSWGGGLFALTKEGEKYQIPSGTKKEELSHPVVYSLLEDDSGILWIGTNGGGINKINPRKANYIYSVNNPDNPKSLSSGKINLIYEDSKGEFWVSVYNRGIERLISEEETYKYNMESKNISSNTVNSIIEIENQLFIGTAKGVLKYFPEKDSFEDTGFVPEKENVYSMSFDGQNLWIGTYLGGLYKYNILDGTLENYTSEDKNSSSLSDNLIYSILSDSKGRVWIGTSNGLNLWDNDKGFQKYFKEEGNQSKLGSNYIRIIFEDSSGKIWIGSVGGGLAYFDESTNTFKNYTENDGLSGNVVVGILEDSSGRIWASTHDGISILNPSSGRIDILTPEDGIGGWEFNVGHFKDENNNLFFGGIHGIVKLNDEFVSRKHKEPRLYITAMELFQESIPSETLFYNNSFFEFNYNENYLGFRVSALDYDSPDKINYYYKLDGFDNDWVNAGSRNYIYYSNLYPGEYKLSVFAETIKNERSNIETLSFVIKNAWYKTIPALIFYVSFLALIIFLSLKIWEDRFLKISNKELFDVNSKLKEANKELENLSTIDSLTGLYNRRYFNEKIKEYVQLAMRSKLHLSIAMIDIDDFKKYNDEYGHISGDKLLSEIGAVILNCLPRKTDFIARYGGDEFVVVLYDTEKEGAKKVFESIYENIKKIDDNKDNLTISIGAVSLIPEGDIEIEKLIKIADDSLYKAKFEGKNRTIFFE